MQVLAGDIGGTKTLLAICDVSPPAGRTGVSSVEVLASSRYESRSYPGLAAICASFAAEVGRPMPRFAGFGVAGPVVDGRTHTTNLPWIVDERDLAQALRVDSVRLANDFHTLALGIPAVGPAELVTLNEGVRDAKGPWAVIGAGTGLGEAIATLGASGHREVLASEGGHTSFAPRNDLEIEVLRFLQRRYDHVSWERLVSGDGLVNLVEALAEIRGRPAPVSIGEAIARDRPAVPPVITAAAASGDPLCREAVELFCELYGAEAGNLALKLMTTGGMYLGGGIAPKMLPKLSGPLFMESFVKKGRMQALLESMPVKVITNDKTALLGAARCAAANLAARK